MKQFIINSVASSELLNPNQRVWIYKQFGLQIGKKSVIAPRVYFAYPDLHNVFIGNNSFINFYTTIDNGEDVVIGNHTCIAPGVRIRTTTHEIGGAERRTGYGCVKKPVIIGDGVWIGDGAVILPGVKIGDGCVIACSAVVREDCEPNYLYAGIPAMKKKLYV